ncbi:MAG: hypothetical protein RLW62_12725 [Gammaproteobacteria bacterium]
MLFFQRFLTVLAASLPVGGVADQVIDVAPPPAVATSCPRVLPEEPLATEYGSAGIMKNLAETEDSIRAVAQRLLQQALEVESRKPSAGCTADCPDAGVAEVIYRVAPMAFLPRPEQNDVCLRFEEKTTREPMRFTPPAFADFAALNTWIADFSQGKGVDGKALYERCSSNCSPRYTFVIGDVDSGYAVEAAVLCGLARDRSSDQYLISTALRRSCAVD